MATNTYVALDKSTVTSAINYVTFNNIPGGYTDLVVVANILGTADSSNIILTFNGATGTAYSHTWVAGSGTAASSSRDSSQPGLLFTAGPLGSSSTTSPGTYTASINNYANTNLLKTVLTRYGTANATYSGALYQIGRWNSTAAITSMTWTTQSTTFAVGTTFSLYGIQAQSALSPTAKATGGTTSTDSFGYVYHTFTSNGTFTPSSTITNAEVLTIGGGGAGGWPYAGGGGAGGVLYSSGKTFTSGVAYTCTIGAGAPAVNANANGAAGSDSTITGSGFTTITATGGGGGAARGSITSAINGGSGGGGSGSTSISPVGGTGIVGQGNTGGTGSYDLSSSYELGGGGGGAGAPGTNAGVTGYADGGRGTATYSSWGMVTGTGQLVSGVYYYGGGGGGGVSAGGTAGVGGVGGGGNGGTGSAGEPTSGTANTGGGGGGHSANSNKSMGGGGSGLIIIKYVG